MRTSHTALITLAVGATLALSACTGAPESDAMASPSTAAATANPPVTQASTAQGQPTSAPIPQVYSTTPSTTPADGSSGEPGTATVFESAVEAGATTRGPVPELPAADQFNPIAVAATAVAAMQTFDAATDTTDADPASRAAYLLTPEYAAQVTTPPLDGQNANWQVWTIQQAWSTVRSFPANIAGPPADTKITATRGVGYIRTIHTDTGEEEQPVQIVRVTMTRTDDAQPWRVDEIEKA